MMDYFSDYPIDNEEDDLLNRSSFSRNLANTLINLQMSGESIVIGLQGKWGSGKTSILNLVIKELKKEDENKQTHESLIKSLILSWSFFKKDENKQEHRYNIFEFHPWLYPETNDLIQLFLAELKLNFIKNNTSKQNFLYKLSNKLNLSNKLIFGSLWILIGGILLLIGYFFQRFISLLPFIWWVIFGVIHFIPKLNQYIDISRLNFPIRYISEDEIPIQFEKKCDQILKSMGNTKLIVFIDDIDRLTPKNIKQIFKLVKTVTRLKNVIYILSFDREYVENSLKEEIPDITEFLEKIIQIPIEIPKIDEQNLQIIFHKKFKKLITNHYLKRDEINPAEIRFPFAYAEDYIKNIRDINRFINTLNFYLTSNINNVNIIDFSLITLLNIYETEIYYEISNNKKLLVDSPSINKDINAIITFPDFDEEFNELKNKYDELIKKSKNKKAVKNIIFYLFPKIRDIFGSKGEPKNQRIMNNQEYLRDKYNNSISIREYFDYYFTLNLNQQIMSNTEYHNYLMVSLSERDFCELLCDLNKNINKINDFMDKLIIELDYNKLTHNQHKNIIKCLFNQNQENYNNIKNKEFIVIQKAIRNITNEETKYELIKNLIKDAENILLATDLINQIKENSIKSESSLKYYEIKLEKSQLNELKKIIGVKIINNLKLGYQDNPLDLIYSWKRLEGYEKIINELNKNNLEKIIELLNIHDEWLKRMDNGFNDMELLKKERRLIYELKKNL